MSDSTVVCRRALGCEWEGVKQGSPLTVKHQLQSPLVVLPALHLVRLALKTWLEAGLAVGVGLGSGVGVGVCPPSTSCASLSRLFRLGLGLGMGLGLGLELWLE